jgi:cytoskeleton protein RodZ
MATVQTANSSDGCTSHPGLRGDGSSLGGLLRHARELRGLTLQEIAKETKLPQRHLEALEQDNLALLPAGFYQRAEIRAYARAVGLDQTILLAHLDSTLKPAEARGAPRDISRTSEPQIRRAYTVIVLTVLTVGMFGYAISERMRTSTPAMPQREQSEPFAPVSTSSKSTVPDSTEATDAVKASDVRVGVSTESAEPRQFAEPRQSAGPRQPAEPRRSTESVTELVVTTEPAGARITVNGIAWGVSPVTIRHLPPGDKRIRVTREGYAAQERVLRLEQGQQGALDISLESTP